MALGEIPLDPNGLRRKDGPSIKTFFSSGLSMSQRRSELCCHDEGGAIYGIMTTNLAEVYNWVIRGVRGMPLVGIIEYFFYIGPTTQ